MRRRWPMLWITLAAVAVTAGSPSPPHWPLDRTPVLTSSFGEYRSNRFHAGIDLGTGGVSGAVCRAVGDGSVVRMRMSPFGYGKALYIQQDGGPLAVYAHLSRFAEPMAARARAEQKRRGAYTFDLTLAAGEMRVRAGDVVAWSGQTGVGVPHLHFELRDGDVARNPQTAGFVVRDEIAPVLSDVRLVPLDPESHVDGGLEPRTVVRGGAPLAVGGRIGVTVRASDQAARGYRQVPYRLELRLDGVLLYRAVQERFDYADIHHMMFEYDPERLAAGERAQRLFHVDGNRLPRDTASGTGGRILAAVEDVPDGALRCPPGRHTIEIEAADVAGHTTTVRAEIRAVPRPRLSLGGTVAGGTLRWRCDADVEGRDPDSLRLAVDVTRDGGGTWTAVRAGEPVTSGAAWRWEGEAGAAAGDAIVVRARLHDGRAMVATVLWAARTASESLASLAMQWTPRFELRGWLQVDLEPDALLASAPEVVAVRRDGRRVSLAVATVDAKRYRATAPFASLAPGVTTLELRAQAADGRRVARREALVARIVRRGEAAHIDDLESGVTIDVPAGAVVEDVAFRVAPMAAPDAAGELMPAGPAFAIEPRAAFFDKPVRISIAGAPTSGASLFALEPGRRPQFLSADRDSNGRLWYESRTVTGVAVLADSTPPAVRGLRLVPRKAAPQRLRFLVRDGGADLGDGAIRTELNGEPVIPEWDPETGEVLVDAERRLPVGSHRLRVVVVDRAGNRTDVTLPFQVR